MRRSAKTLTSLTALALSGTLIGGCSLLDQLAPGEPSSPTATASPSPGGAERQATTAAVVEASNAFLATLSDEQRAKVVLDVDDPGKESGWNSLPVIVGPPRSGIQLTELDQAQRDALDPVLRAALSEQGYTQVQAIRAADTYLSTAPPEVAPPPVVDPPVEYGENRYFVAFFGEPSTSEPFQLGFTGHHLGENVTFTPDAISVTPQFVGVEPTTYERDDVTFAPLALEVETTSAVLAALEPDQIEAASIPGTFDDPLLGPGEEADFPAEPEGVLVSDLTQEQQDTVTAMLGAWVGDADEATAEDLLAGYVADYDQTRVGLAGSTSLQEAGDYVRVDGPRVWVELQAAAPDEGEVAVHYHTVYRDEALDYGGL